MTKEDKKKSNKFIYVLDINGKPLMPTKRFGKVRHLLKTNKAIIVYRHPFTIRLTYETTDYTQPITLGIDSGTAHCAGSATTSTEELLAMECKLRTDIVDLISTRRECRQTRRNYLRYRKARFNNRKKSKKKGWLPPSTLNKIHGNEQIVKFVRKILPISKIIVEIGIFDQQKINNPDISGVEYQQGEQLGSYNVREYVMCRDNHQCQLCKGKSGDSVLHVHHIESRKTGGNSPKNLITLCKTCHNEYHKTPEKFDLKLKRASASLRDAAYMNIMKHRLLENIKANNPDIPVKFTYGYITKYNRIKYNVEKSHTADARMISKNFDANPCNNRYLMFQRRRHNRQIYKMKILKSGKLKRNQTDYKIKGFCLFDIVEYDSKMWFISGRRKRGQFCLKDEFNNKIEVNYKKLKFISRNNIL